MAKSAPLEKIIELTKQLSLLDKVRLIEKLAPQIEHELRAKVPQPAERTPVGGLWEGVATSEEDIATARGEMWRTFPRQGI